MCAHRLTWIIFWLIYKADIFISFFTNSMVNQMFILNRATMRKPFVDGLACELELLSFSSSWLHWELANWLRPPLKCQTKEWSVWSANLSTGNWALHSRLARAFWKLFVLCMCKRCLIWGMKAWVLGRTVSLLQITCLISNHSTYSSTLSTQIYANSKWKEILLENFPLYYLVYLRLILSFLVNPLLWP